MGRDGGNSVMVKIRRRCKRGNVRLLKNNVRKYKPLPNLTRAMWWAMRYILLCCRFDTSLKYQIKYENLFYYVLSDRNKLNIENMIVNHQWLRQISMKLLFLTPLFYWLKVILIVIELI